MNRMYSAESLAERGASRAMSVNRVYNFVYGWMSVALGVSGFVAWWVAEAVRSDALNLTRGHLIGCCIAELALVIIFSAMVTKMKPALATLIFMLYAALNGVTLSVLLLVYTPATIQTAFFVTAGTFASMALFGTLTRRNLSVLERLGMMALFGFLIASLVNWFIGSSALEMALCYIGVAIFVGLTAYDAQKVRILAEQQATLDRTTINRLGICCALELYLDFVNLFIMIIRLLGDRR